MSKKIQFTALSIIFIGLLFSQCSKDDTNSNTNIVYPDSGFYGKNLLNISDTIYQYDEGPGYGDGYYHSMKAILPETNSSLTVEVTGTRIVIYQNQGWFTDADFNYTENTKFRAEGLITADLKIHLLDEGDAIIKLYENDSEIPTRTKHIKKEN